MLFKIWTHFNLVRFFSLGDGFCRKILSYLHFCLYCKCIFFIVSQSRVCECVWPRLSEWQMKEDVMECCYLSRLNVCVPSGCVLDQLIWRQGEGGRGGGWAGWQYCLSGPIGWVNNLPLTPSFALAIIGISTQLCTCTHIHVPTHTP